MPECSSENFWRTNKATFVREGGVVRKRYFRQGDAVRDARLLRLIEEVYAPSLIDAWCYRPLHVVEAEAGGNELTMEYIDAPNLGALYEGQHDPSLFVHAGRWLGELHRASRNDDGFVLAFNDFNRTNLLVDRRGRCVVAVDPGGYQRVRSPPAVALVMGAFSIARATLQARKGPVAALAHYLRGYREGTRAASLPPLTPGFRRLEDRMRRRRSKPLLSSPEWLARFAIFLECRFLRRAMEAAARSDASRPGERGSVCSHGSA